MADDMLPAPTAARPAPIRALITAGPTHEPLDAVRYLGNRSSGRLGVALARAALRRGWDTTLLLGPVATDFQDSPLRVRRFRTTADLSRLMEEETQYDVLLMAAAVADFRPSRAAEGDGIQKWSRSDGPVTVVLEPTPDLLAAAAARRRPGQVLVGFALEPLDRLLDAAREKLRRKNVDLIVANDLATPESDRIEAFVLMRDGTVHRPPGCMSKSAFAGWLLDVVEPLVREARR